MLSIGAFSNMCKVSTKTLRYYAEIGLLVPDEINPENGYRYYSVQQLETMLFINRLKGYNFSLEEIKAVLESEAGEKLFPALIRKQKELEALVRNTQSTLEQLRGDLSSLEQGESIMAYLENIDVQLVEAPSMNLLSVRKMVHESEYAEAYGQCFGRLFKRIADEKLTMLAPPMALFHSAEYTPAGMDTEFAIPVEEYVTGTRDFAPGLCLKTVVHGAYSQLSAVYTKQYEWAKREGYESSNALFEVYVTDPSDAFSESDYITEVYYPVKRRSQAKEGT